MNHTPKVLDDEMYRLLRDDQIEEFNRRRDQGVTFDFRGADFRKVNLQGADVHDIDFTNCYFWQANLRGVDMSTCRLEGNSIRDDRISGTYFPSDLSLDEILISWKHGTRMRCRS